MANRKTKAKASKKDSEFEEQEVEESEEETLEEDSEESSEAPAEEIDEFYSEPESRLPETSIPVEVKKHDENRIRVVEQRVVHTNNETDEILMGISEPRNLPDEPLPDMMELLGRDPLNLEDEPMNTAEPRAYETKVMNATQGENLIVYPAIAAGRCEICGSTRFVDRKNGMQGEVWRIVNRKNGEAKYSYRRGEWIEVHAANCPHYRNVDIRCSYCNEGFTGQKDKKGQFVELLASRILWVFADRRSPRDLVMVCSDMNCKSKFDEQFHLNQRV